MRRPAAWLLTSVMGVVTVAGLAILSAGPATASCAADSGPEGSPVIFTGTPVGERRGYTEFEVDEVWAGPDLADHVWVLSGQEQPPWPFYALQSVGSGEDATFEPGETYAVGASRDFATDDCSIAAPDSVARLRHDDPRVPVADGSRGADPPAGPWLTSLGFVALVAVPVGLVTGLVVWRRRRG